MILDSELPRKTGIYTLILEIARPTEEKIGRLNYRYFLQGLYAYTGSALGESINLKTRLSRHLTSKKRRYWHIDYLLGVNTATIRGIIYILTSTNAECQIVKGLQKLPEIKVPIRGFGSSDCHSGCNSHLCYFADASLEWTIAEISKVYRKIFSSLPIYIVLTRK